jgi:hypothetical protein
MFEDDHAQGMKRFQKEQAKLPQSLVLRSHLIHLLPFQRKVFCMMHADHPVSRHYRLLVIALTTAIALSILAFYVQPRAQALSAGFRVEGSRIIGPNGNTFTPRGIAILGPDSYWLREPQQPGFAAEADMIKNLWRFNAVRIFTWVPGHQSTEWPIYHDSEPLDGPGGLIDVYTSRGIVVVIQQGSGGGAWNSDTPDTKSQQWLDWWCAKANMYKDNPYVWFDLYNEPWSDPAQPLPQSWLRRARAGIEAVRGTGANNIILLQGHWAGQDVGQWDSSLVRSDRSAILTYGPQLVQQYSNLVFDFHVYDQWVFGDTKMADYIDRVHQQGLALVAGEFGPENGYQNPSTQAAVTSLWNVGPPRGLGYFAWHWSPGDGNILTAEEKPAAGWKINRLDGSRPTNLYEPTGGKLWDQNHAAPAPPPVATATPSITPPQPTATPAPGETIIDDKAAAWSYSPNFSQAASAGAYGGTTRVGWVAWDSAQVSFTGTRVKVYGRKFAQGKTADIFIDGTQVASGVSFAGAEQQQALIWTSGSLTPGTHTIKIVTRGDWIEIDYLAVTSSASTPTPVPPTPTPVPPTPVPPTPTPVSTIIDDKAASWSYSPNFSQAASVNAYGGTTRVGWVAWESAQVSFTGSRVKVYGRKFAQGKTADIFIDGTQVASGVSFAGAEQQQALIWTSGSLTPGTHTIKIVTRGDWIEIDYLQVN